MRCVCFSQAIHIFFSSDSHFFLKRKNPVSLAWDGGVQSFGFPVLFLFFFDSCAVGGCGRDDDGACIGLWRPFCYLFLFRVQESKIILSFISCVSRHTFLFLCPSCQERSQKNGDIGCFGFLFDFASRSEVSSFLRLLASGRVCAILTGENGRG